MSKTERITGDLTIDPTGNFKVSAPIVAQSLTTTQRTSLTGVNGMIIYNSTLSKLQAYAGGAWVSLH
jgi:hypothetical protein